MQGYGPPIGPAQVRAMFERHGDKLRALVVDARLLQETVPFCPSLEVLSFRSWDVCSCSLKGMNLLLILQQTALLRAPTSLFELLQEHPAALLNLQTIETSHLE
jgi:hypothetical protein